LKIMKKPTMKQIAAYCIREVFDNAAYTLGDNFDSLTEKQKDEAVRHMENMLKPMYDRMDNIVGEQDSDIGDLR